MVSRKKKTDVVELEARKSSKEDKRASNSSKVERVTQEEFDDYIIQYSEITLQKKLGEGSFVYVVFNFQVHLVQFIKANTRKQKLLSKLFLQLKSSKNKSLNLKTKLS